MTENGYNRRRQCVDWFCAINAGMDHYCYDYVNECIDADYYNYEREAPDTIEKAMIVEFFDNTVFKSEHKIPVGPIGPDRWVPALEYFA